MVNLLLTVTTIILGYKTFVFVLSIFLKRNDIADVSWGLSFILIVIVTLVYTSGLNLSLILVSTLVGIWGLRLSLRVATRNAAKKEDFRYKKIRESGNFFFIRSFLQVYLLQGLLAIIVGFPIVHLGVNGAGKELDHLSYLGLVVWLVGFFFETVADYQLDKFTSKTENKGKILKNGLWKYSRHPNYFGEITMWWGIFLISLSIQPGIYSIISPLTITFLITKVSGIPMLEEKYNGNKSYEDYRTKTSVLIPFLNLG